MEDQIKAVISEIRPRLQMDGGDIEFVSLEGDQVSVRLKGACAGCPSAAYTLAAVVERIIKERVPGVAKVVSV
jgi:Fe-S cluster biogenesis protein NfuA